VTLRLRLAVGSLLTVLILIPALSGRDAAVAREARDQAVFKIACSVFPFEVIKKTRPVDGQCGLNGDANKKTDGPRAAQNEAKNNFCAGGTPVLATNFTFRHLQSDTEAKPAIDCCGDANLPTDRSLLMDIHTTDSGEKVGEGTLVRFIRFPMKGKYSNTGKGNGESVNCRLEDREENDIHLVIAPTKPSATATAAQLDTLECKSVVVEISPHARPEPWEVLGNLHKTSSSSAVHKIQGLELHRPMRFTGQAFFDASHRPCKNGKPQDSSKRVSNWEVHPVYAIDVCKNTTLANCKDDNAAVWVPLHTWLAMLDDGN
jgi:hypothetical protein